MSNTQTTTNTHDNDQFIEDTKVEISETLKDALKEKNLSIRKLAQSIGMQHPQILRVTSGENYTINNLLKILDAAGLRLEIQKKEDE